MSHNLPALVTIALLATGAVLSRLAPRKETRYLGVAHASLALASAVATAIVAVSADAAVGDSTSFGLLNLDAVVVALLAPLSAVALGMVLATPERETGHRTVAQALTLPCLTMLSLMANQLLSLLAIEALLAIIAVEAVEQRALKTHLLVRGGGIAGVLLALLFVPAELLLLPLEQAVPAMGLPSLTLMLVGVGALLGVGPLSIMLRAAYCNGMSARAILTTLPFGGMALLVRVVGPGFVHQADDGTSHLVIQLLLGCALTTAALVLVQRTAAGAVALVIATSNALTMVGLIASDESAKAGGQLLWAANLLAATGFALALLALRARHGRLGLDGWSGYQASSSRLGALVLLFALALGGLPGTANFMGLDLVLHGDVSHHLDTMILCPCVMALLGFATVRIAFRLLFGPPPHDDRDDDMPLLRREQQSLYPIACLLFAAGLAPMAVPVIREQSRVMHGVSSAYAPSASCDHSHPDSCVRAREASAPQLPVSVPTTDLITKPTIPESTAQVWRPRW